MGQAPGTKTKRDANTQDAFLPGWFHATGRLVGFVLISGTAVAILAAVVLLPRYAQLKRLEYRVGCKRAETAELRQLVGDQEHVIAAACSDPVLIRRLAINQCDMWPADAAVMPAPSGPVAPPHAIAPEPVARPRPPATWLLSAAARLQRPAHRRGLLLIAAALMGLAVLVFAGKPEPAA